MSIKDLCSHAIIGFIAFAVVSPNCAQGQANPENPLVTVEALRLNSLGLRKFDVLLHRSSTADREDLGYTYENWWIRIVCDHERQVCAQFVSGDRNHLTVSEDGLSPENSDILSCVLIKGQNARWRQWPDAQKTSQHDSFESAIIERDVLFFDFVGILPFPMSKSPRFAFQRLDDPVDYKEKYWNFLKSTRSSAKIANDVPSRIKYLFGPYDVFGRQSWVEVASDRKTLLPIRQVVQFGAVDNRENDSTETFEWKERGDVFVPVEIENTFPQATRLPNNELLTYTKRWSVKLHWFSVNEDVDDRLLKDAVLEDPQKVRLYTDAKNTNATSLIEKK